MSLEQNLPSVSGSVSSESEPVKRKHSSDSKQLSSTKKSKVTDATYSSNDSTQENKKQKSKKAVKPEAKKKAVKSSPTWFLSFQISNPNSHHSLRQAQETILETHPVFRETMVAVSKAHITLFLFNPDQDGVTDARLDELCQSIESGVDDWRRDSKRGWFIRPMSMRLEEVGHFRNQVIYVQPHWTDEEFPDLWQALATRLLQDGFISERDAEFNQFKPHVTICKMSKVRNWKQLKKLPRSFPTHDILEKISKIDFGEQHVSSLQLLSMTKPPVTDVITKGSYYHCHKEFTLPCDDDVTGFSQVPSSSDHEWCCCTPLGSSKPQSEALDFSSSSSSSSTRPLGVSGATLPLLLIVGGGLLALTIARHMLRG